MIESKHRSELHKLLSSRIYAMGTTGICVNGVADAWYSGTRMGLWSEHKRFPRVPPVIDLTNPDITTVLQQNWLVARHDEGRAVSMIVFADNVLKRQAGCLLLTDLDWQLPITREEFLDRMKTRRELADEIVKLVGEIPGGPGP